MSSDQTQVPQQESESQPSTGEQRTSAEVAVTPAEDCSTPMPSTTDVEVDRQTPAAESTEDKFSIQTETTDIKGTDNGPDDKCVETNEDDECADKVKEETKDEVHVIDGFKGADNKLGEVTSSTGQRGDKSSFRRNRQTSRSQNFRRNNKPVYTRRFVGYYQVQNSYGIKTPPYKSNFEPSETARQKADEFLKVIRQQQ